MPLTFPGYEASPEDQRAFMRQQLACDVFFTSSNALIRDGFLVNIDGTGNRIAASTFGPGKAAVLAGMNKVVPGEEAAFERLRSVAAPVNMKELELPNPCTKTGYCVDCRTDTRGRCYYSVLRRRPIFSDIRVILAGRVPGLLRPISTPLSG